jgi:hypothetical protein
MQLLAIEAGLAGNASGDAPDAVSLSAALTTFAREHLRMQVLPCRG